MKKEADTSIFLAVDEPMISFSTSNSEVFRIEKSGKMVWTVDGEARVCEDYKDLAKAFMYTIFRLFPDANLRGLSPEIYEEIKHLVEPNNS